MFFLSSSFLSGRNLVSHKQMSHLLKNIKYFCNSYSLYASTYQSEEVLSFRDNEHVKDMQQTCIRFTDGEACD